MKRKVKTNNIICNVMYATVIIDRKTRLAMKVGGKLATTKSNTGGAPAYISILKHM